MKQVNSNRVFGSHNFLAAIYDDDNDDDDGDDDNDDFGDGGDNENLITL